MDYKINPIPKEILDQFIHQICTNIVTDLKLSLNSNNIDDIKTIIIFTNNIKESETVHKLLIEQCNYKLGQFIELKTGIDRKYWNRSISLFESKVEPGSVILSW